MRNRYYHVQHSENELSLKHFHNKSSTIGNLMYRNYVIENKKLTWRILLMFVPSTPEITKFNYAGVCLPTTKMTKTVKEH